MYLYFTKLYYVAFTLTLQLPQENHHCDNISYDLFFHCRCMCSSSCLISHCIFVVCNTSSKVKQFNLSRQFYILLQTENALGHIVGFLRYLNSTNFADIDRCVKFKSLKKTDQNFRILIKWHLHAATLKYINIHA